MMVKHLFNGSGISYLIRFSFRYYFYVVGVAALMLISSCESGSAENTGRTEDTTLIILPPATTLSPGLRAKYKEQCNRWYDSILKNSNFSGGILVAKNGNIIFEQYKGLGNNVLPDSLIAQTPLHIASVTKTFTAMAVLKLMEEGKINIENEVSTYLPSFNYAGVTVRTLLNHRSGLPNYLYFMEDLGWEKSRYITNRDILDTMTIRKKDIKNIGSPDRNFNYCNTNYVILALIIEKVSGLKYAEYLHKTFFHPLGMSNTFVFAQQDTSRIKPSYDWRGSEIPFNFLDVSYGDKNIYSTPRDLLIWDRALSANVLVSPQTMELAQTPYSNERPGIRNYGLGWRMNIYPTGRKMVFHNGWWHGNNAVFIRLPEDDATIIALGNRYTTAIYKARQLANIFSFYFPTTSDDNGHD